MTYYIYIRLIIRLILYIKLIIRVSVKYDELFKSSDSITSRRLVEIQNTSEMTPYFTMTKCNKLFVTYLTRSTPVFQPFQPFQ